MSIKNFKPNNALSPEGNNVLALSSMDDEELQERLKYLARIEVLHRKLCDLNSEVEYPFDAFKIAYELVTFELNSRGQM